jgi:hypothetical protein
LSTSKSTVLGLRLDHDRRAWIEAEAARRGVTVRILFEEMIDRGRSGETEADPVASSEAPPESQGINDPSGAETGAPNRTDRGTGRPTALDPPPHASWASSPLSPPRPRLCPDVMHLAALPVHAMRAAASFTATLIESNDRLPRWSAVIFRRIAGSEPGK